MAEILRRVPYEVLMLARDAKSGERISNTLYYATAGAGTYAGALGGSNNATILAAIIARWTGSVVPVLSVNYVMVSARMRAIIGWKFPSPQVVVVGVTPGLTFTSIATAGSHGLTTGDAVSIQGTAGVPGLNAYWVGITVTSPTTFTIPVSLAGALSVFGTVQQVAGEQELTYRDNLEIVDTTVGGIAGEAIPLYCAASVRRLNSGVGRNWRSRISLSPLGESQNENGKFSAAAFATFETAINALNNQETDGVAIMFPSVISRTLAFQEATPFTDELPWQEFVSDHAARQNLGSMVSRKPKLTAVIS